MSGEPGPTPSQTIGPFFHDALLERDLSELVAPDHPEAITILGVVYDGAGEPVTDGMVEISQSTTAGYREGPHTLDGGFSDWGRSGTTDGGQFRFVTLKPDAGEHGQAPHIDVSVFARGLLKRAVTRLYFPDEEQANAGDPVLASIEDAEFRGTLIARAEGDAYRFDIRLQGEGQTAFFEFGE